MDKQLIAAAVIFVFTALGIAFVKCVALIFRPDKPDSTKDVS